MSSIGTLLFFFIFVLSSINYVSSIKCYVCVSDVYGDCYHNPAKNKEYVVECGESRSSKSESSGFLFGYSEATSDFNQSIAQGGELRSLLDYNCATVKGTILGEKIVFRTCSFKLTSCSLLLTYLPMAPSKVEDYYCCNSHICNSSNKMTTTFWSIFIFSVLLLIINM